jgi:hypothetical protein
LQRDAAGYGARHNSIHDGEVMRTTDPLSHAPVPAVFFCTALAIVSSATLRIASLLLIVLYIFYRLIAKASHASTVRLRHRARVTVQSRTTDKMKKYKFKRRTHGETFTYITRWQLHIRTISAFAALKLTAEARDHFHLTV